MESLAPVILSGGSGTRLWPLSREKYPKQLLPLIGKDSLLQATVRRMEGLTGLKVESPLVVCNEEYRFIIAEQLRLMGIKSNLLLEPAGRNTAPALTLAALAVASQQQDPVLLVMPADHVIVNTVSFQTAVKKAVMLAAEGAMVTFGIMPDSPETGYGYIQAGEPVGSDGVCRIARFVEKPDITSAQAYLDSGSHFWNSGLFLMRTSVWLSAIGICRSDILAACRAAWEKGSVDGDFLRVNKEEFLRCPSDSIDYAVMERLSADNSALPPGMLIPLSAGWSDVGAWDSLWQVLPKDAQGNVAQGDVLLHECNNTLVVSEHRLVACVGVEDMVVVETPDAVLVAHMRETQHVKKVVDSLKRQGRPEGELHRK
ncbi:MAG TPA: mannose-1-phosphate guanylyltransferase/mannose-6-phosphate isomerase, partial [Nitrosospira sp.]|nr:mannose-1-phosphate guanylyltransferase/mannose-6-phosphate isomerase [Nitrosospira sp.]